MTAIRHLLGGGRRLGLDNIARSRLDDGTLANRLPQNGVASFVKSWPRLLQRIGDRSFPPLDSTREYAS